MSAEYRHVGTFGPSGFDGQGWLAGVAVFVREEEAPTPEGALAVLRRIAEEDYRGPEPEARRLAREFLQSC